MLKGKQLDEYIENELKEMVAEGLEQSPISASALHARLVSKGVINGGLSTLSNATRKNLIKHYTTEQLLPLNLKEKEEQLYINRRTRKALINSNQMLKDKVNELEERLNSSNVALMEIVKQVQLKTNLQLDELLAPYLMTDFEPKSKLKVI